MVEYISYMETSVSYLVEAICQTQETMPSATHLASSIRKTVKNKMNQELAPTNVSIDEVKALVVSSLERRNP